MIGKSGFLIALLAFPAFLLPLVQSREVGCYYESWAVWDGFTPENINTDICTIIFYAFLGIQPGGQLRWLEDDDSVVRRISSLKDRNPNVRLVVSVGGWSEGATNFSVVANDAGLRQTFANEVNDFLNTYNFDGVDIDWEYPGQRGGNWDADWTGYIEMLRALKQTTGRLVTSAVSSDPSGGAYDVNAMNDVLDFVNLMTYDFNTEGSNPAGQNSPLYSGPGDSDWERDTANVDASVRNWIGQGLQPAKVLVGLAFYGYSFRLADPGNFYPHPPTAGTGDHGGSYAAICDATNGFTNGEFAYEWDADRRVPYMHSGDELVVYDNEQSIAEKVQYANNQGLGGVMMWSVDQDPQGGPCGNLPLLNAVRNNLA